MISTTPSHTTELFIGLVSAAGTDLDFLCKTITEEMALYGYYTHVISLSQKIAEIKHMFDLPDEHSNEAERIEKLIDGGNTIRRETKNKAAIAALSIDAIRGIRTGDADKPDNIEGPRCYLLRSFKNPDEIRLFRKIYRDHFLLMSIYEQRDKRVKNLARRIANSSGHTDSEQYRSAAEQIITRDFKEDDSFGQNVSDAFAEADFFLHLDDRIRIIREIERFFKICFGYPFHTPRRDEMGMYWAKSAAYRSADLSRQVGSAITNKRGELLATGCNEVPTRGGGLPWEDEEFDPRDFTRGHDENTRIRNAAIKEVLVALKQAKWLKKQFAKKIR